MIIIPFGNPSPLINGAAANWPYQIDPCHPEAVGLEKLIIASPQGMIDLVSGVIGSRNGTSDPGNVSESGSFSAYFDGIGDSYTISDSGAVDTSSPFTIVWEARLDSFVDQFPAIVVLRRGVVSNPLRIFYSNDSAYDDITIGFIGNGVSTTRPSAVSSMVGRTIFGVWSFAGGAFSTLSSHTVWMDGDECSVSAASSLASITDETRVGGSSAATTDWNGSIRQVRLYSREWTQEEAFAFWNPSTRDSIFLKESRAIFLPSAGGGGAVSAEGILPSLSLSAATGSATGAATASADLPTASLSSPTGEATGSATTGGSLAPLSLTETVGSATGSATASVSLPAIALSAQTGSAVGACTASGAISWLSIAPPAGTAFSGAGTVADGSLSQITLSAPTGGASGSASASGMLQPLALSTLAASASGKASCAAALPVLSLTPCSGSASSAAPASRASGFVFCRVETPRAVVRIASTSCVVRMPRRH